VLTQRAENCLGRVSRLYRAFLVVLPPPLRREYAAQLATTFRDVSADVFVQKGWVGMVLAWSRMFGELMLVAPREYLSLITVNLLSNSPRRRGSNRMHLGDTMQNIVGNIRIALRQLRRNPAFAATAVITLAMGIGANTAIFTVLHSVMLRPLAFHEPDELAAIWLEFTRDDGVGREIAASEPEFLEFRDQTQSFESVGGYWTGETNLGGIEEPERVRGAAVSANVLSLLGVAPILGRMFSSTEDEPGTERVAMLGHSLWQQSFGADTSVVGASVLINGLATTIIGVLPRTFRFPGYDAQIFRPNIIDRQNPAGRASHYLSLVGRLKPGVSLETAVAETATLMSAWTTAFPDRHGPTVRNHPIVMTGLHNRLVGDSRATIFILSGAVTMVLLIACANVAGLLLARAESRQREMAIRSAIGAGKTRLIGQLLTESLVLATIGGLLGLALASIGVRAIAVVGPTDLPTHADLSVNAVVMTFAILVSLVAGIAFGLAPAIAAGRANVALAFRDGAGTSTVRRLVFRRALIVTEMAVALVLAVGAGLLIKSLARLSRIDPGFETDGVVTMQFSLNSASYPEVSDVARFHRELATGLQSLPGVIASGAIRALPLTGGAGMETLTLVGRPQSESEPSVNTEYQVTGAGYFDALSIPIIQGRTFTERDTETAEPVVVINRRMADLYWSDGDPIGKQIQVGAFPGNTNPIMTIVGVVGDVRQVNLGTRVNPQIFVPRQQAGAIYGGFVTRSATLVVRAETEPISTMRMVREALRELDPNLPIADLQTMKNVVSGSISDERFTSFAMGLFSAVALVLGAIGVYGLMAYTVAQRTREIGVRIALGADQSRVQRSVVGQGLILAGSGIAAGVLVALGVTRFMSGLLFELDTRDPGIFVTVPVLLFLTAAVAAYVPARKAAAVDPVEAMRT
jgi:predicted permease